MRLFTCAPPPPHDVMSADRVRIRQPSIKLHMNRVILQSPQQYQPRQLDIYILRLACSSLFNPKWTPSQQIQWSLTASKTPSHRRQHPPTPNQTPCILPSPPYRVSSSSREPLATLASALSTTPSWRVSKSAPPCGQKARLCACSPGCRQNWAPATLTSSRA